MFDDDEHIDGHKISYATILKEYAKPSLISKLQNNIVQELVVTMYLTSICK